MRALPVVLLALLGLAACGDPLKSVPRLSDVEVSEQAGQAEALAAPGPETLAQVREEPLGEKPKRGLLGFLRRQADATSEPSSPEVLEVAPVDAEQTAEIADAAGDEPPSETVLAALPAPVVDDAGDSPRGGLLGGLFGGNRGATDKADGKDDAKKARAKEPKPGAPDYRQVGPGVTLPFGEMARLCGAPAGKLGSRAAKYPERGRGYTLYDSAPGSTGMRNFYLTGFDDGCARQFTAALAIFGEPEIYEQIRYGAPSKTQPVAETDAAYERVKSRVCRVARGKPCGSRIRELSKDTVFVSVYERFGSNARWKNVLLHDGEVVALDVKSR